MLLFFLSFLGLPLFLRRLNAWGAVMLALWLFNLVVTDIIPDPEELAEVVIGFSLIWLGLDIFLAVKGNELTAKNYLERGWTWADPDDLETGYARAK